MTKVQFIIDIAGVSDYDCIKRTGYLTGNINNSREMLHEKKEERV